MVSFLPGEEFLVWFFTYFMDDINCPHCDALITREEIESTYEEGDDFVVCPQCKKKINKDDLE